MRGLADSGQRAIADVQSQQAYGETLSGLYGQKQEVEQQAVQQRQIIEQNVQAAVTEANVQRGFQQLESDTQLYQQVQAIDDQKKAQVANLIQLAAEGMNPQTVKELANAYGISEDELTSVLNASTYFDPTGDLNIQERWDWDTVFSKASIGAGAGAAVGTAINPGLGSLIGAAVGFASVFIGEAANQFSNSITMGGDINVRSQDGTLELSGNRAQVIEQINQRYTTLEGSDQIKASFDGGFLGQSEDVVFYYNGAKYRTYNEALAALRGQSTQPQE